MKLRKFGKRLSSFGARTRRPEAKWSATALATVSDTVVKTLAAGDDLPPMS
jgi:hypothetical protein